jgi:hypothetical protein
LPLAIRSWGDLRGRDGAFAELFPALGNNRGLVRVKLRVVRPGFFVASLTLHAVVVGVVWHTAKDGLRPVTATSPSGLVATSAQEELGEVEITPWQPPVLTPTEPPANADPLKDVSEKPPTDAPATPTPKGAALESEQKTAPPSAAQRTAPKTPKPRPVTPPAEQKPSADDWLSIEQQLPEEAESNGDSTPAATPKRDVLVERLLAKERDAQRLAAEDETRRRAASSSSPSSASSSASAGSSPSVSTPAKTATTPRVADERAPTSRDEVFGESRARADLWVELTRWLPRAASTDPTWEQLPANSSYEFRVELTTENGAIVASRVRGDAPPSAARLLTQTAHLMGRGKYGGTRRTVHRFELRVRLTTTTGRDLWIAHTTPDPPKPGVGSFIAPSGRRFDVWVTQLQ